MKFENLDFEIRVTTSMDKKINDKEIPVSFRSPFKMYNIGYTIFTQLDPHESSIN